ncbi:multicopper oxidase family protein [Amycolatopsis nigrescens]|uniref:multicopper oxidase family protein n=1 Tax=Amycolatopsis nigrescens TaxID=381445 RepID=UPI00037988F7|nr:multicopper oxidase domain-containing protein [Amycolatopsis nigrescens]
MEFSRKEFLRFGLAAGAGLLLPGTLSACSSSGGGGANNTTESSAGTLLKSKTELPPRFTARLPVPPVLAPVRTDGSTDYYEITQKVGQVEILPGRKTEIWGYNGIFPGPTIESRTGRRTSVVHRNELGVPVTVHLHGGKVAPEHDGYPTDLIAPVSGGHAGHTSHTTTMAAGSKEYLYPMDQQAATLWYHDHRMDFTGPQVYKGLAGFHLIRDDVEERLGLPRGERDVPLMIADRAFNEDGSFSYPSVDPSLSGTPGVTGDFMSGVLGDCILVNGAPWPVLEVSNTKYRFRILNASNARRYRLELDKKPSGGPAFLQIGSDQGLLDTPAEHDELQISQAERFDVIIDFSKYSVGDEITMRNSWGEDSTADVMKFKVARQAADSGPIPSQLVPFTKLSKSEATVTRDIVFARGGAEAHGMSLWTVNGEAFDPNKIIANPRLGSVELWNIRAQNVEHPFHIHLAPFQVLSKDGNDPSEYDRGWKDTVSLENGGKAELLVKFEGFKGKYVLHCHNLEHEDMMMMANFEVV